MARKIRSTQQILSEGQVETIPADGVVFANNAPNREFIYGEGKKFKFKGTREIITDKALIELLDGLAKNDRMIFRVDPPAVAPEVEDEEQIEPEPEPTDEATDTETTTETK